MVTAMLHFIPAVFENSVRCQISVQRNYSLHLGFLTNIYIFISKYFELGVSNEPDFNKGVHLSEECRLHALCVPIDLTGVFFTVKSSFEHIWSCFCGARRAAPIS